MRVRTNIIIEESLLAKIDQIAGDKLKRESVIETALREFIARNESKTLSEIDEKAEVSVTK